MISEERLDVHCSARGVFCCCCFLQQRGAVCGVRHNFQSYMQNKINEARRPHTCSRPCAFEVRRKENEKKKRKNPAAPKTHHEINPQQPGDRDHLETAYTVKHVLRVSPYSHSSSIDPGLVEIGLACRHHTCVLAQLLCRLLYTLVRLMPLYFLASAIYFSTAVICISDFGVVRWCLTLSFP